MKQVFFTFKALFEKRYASKSSLLMGEDSLRYDFFIALMQEKELSSWQIHLEHPLHKDAFTRTVNEKRKRNEKPQIDLFVDEDDLKLGVEFGFFRRNSNDSGDIARTENTFKVLNDMLRLGIHSYLSGSDCYFVCIADAKMLGYQLGNNVLDAFPAARYEFNDAQLSTIMDGYKSSKKIDSRFLQTLVDRRISIAADLVFCEQLTSTINPLKTQVLIWQVGGLLEAQPAISIAKPVLDRDNQGVSLYDR